MIMWNKILKWDYFLLEKKIIYILFLKIVKKCDEKSNNNWYLRMIKFLLWFYVIVLCYYNDDFLI